MPTTLPPVSIGEDEQQQSNLSNTTLRRKLFEGMIEDSDDDEDKAIPPSSEGDQPGTVTQVLEARNHLQHDSTKRQKEGNKDDAAAAADDDDKEKHLMSSPIKADILSPNQVVVLTPIQNQAPSTAVAANGKNVSPPWVFLFSYIRIKVSSNGSR